MTSDFEKYAADWWDAQEAKVKAKPNPNPGQPPSPGEDWCYSCNRSEPIPPDGAFWVCGECHHCWPTADDFIIDVRQMLEEVGGRVELDVQVLKAWPFCPRCSHDL